MPILHTRLLRHCNTGAVEVGVQGVQLHTHFLAPSFDEQSSFVWKNLGLLNLHTHILVPSTAPAVTGVSFTSGGVFYPI